MSKRKAIIQLCARRTNPEITKLLKVAKFNVYHVVNRFEELVHLKTVLRVKDLALLEQRRWLKLSERGWEGTRRPDEIYREKSNYIYSSVTSERTIVKKTNSSCLPTRRERGSTSHLPKSTRDLKEQGSFLENWRLARHRERSFFSNDRLFTIETNVNNQYDKVYAKCSSDIEDSVRIVFSRQKPFSPVSYTHLTLPTKRIV